MHDFVSFDAEIISADGAFLPAVSAAAMYGRGVFTTVAVFSGEPFLWDKHWRRLSENALRLGVGLSEISEAFVSLSFDALIAANGVSKGRARIGIYDRGRGGAWSGDDAAAPALIIMTGDLMPRRNETRLTLSAFPVNSASPLAGIKSCNYLENLIAFEDAKQRGFDEAIRLNERGEVVSGCMSNIFWIRDGRLFTPALSTGCLAGTTREFILENSDCTETKAGIDELLNADALFLTSAGVGIMPAASLNETKFGAVEISIPGFPDYG